VEIEFWVAGIGKVLKIAMFIIHFKNNKIITNKNHLTPNHNPSTSCTG